MNYQSMADKVESKGRHGDSVLVHMHPAEVAGIASLTPGGLTTNPDTGKPEAFAFLIPMLAAWGGGALGASALGATLGTAAATGLGAFAGGTLGSLAIGKDTQTSLLTGALSGLGGALFAPGGAVAAEGGAATAAGAGEAATAGAAPLAGNVGATTAQVAPAPLAPVTTTPLAPPAQFAPVTSVPQPTGWGYTPFHANTPSAASGISAAAGTAAAPPALSAESINATMAANPDAFGGVGASYWDTLSPMKKAGVSGLGLMAAGSIANEWEEDPDFPASKTYDFPEEFPDEQRADTVRYPDEDHRGGIDEEHRYFPRRFGLGGFANQMFNPVNFAEGSIRDYKTFQPAPGLNNALGQRGAGFEALGPDAYKATPGSETYETGRLMNPVNFWVNAGDQNLPTNFEDVGNVFDSKDPGYPRGRDYWAEDAERQRRAGTAYGARPITDGFAGRYARGGMVSSDNNEIDMVMQEAEQAIMGLHDNPEAAIQRFIAMFGEEAFAALRQRVISKMQGQSAEPGPGQGRLIKGGGREGADGIPAVVTGGRGKEPIEVGENEYIVPPDTLRGIGGGDLAAGKDQMDRLVAQTTGTQPVGAGQAPVEEPANKKPILSRPVV